MKGSRDSIDADVALDDFATWLGKQTGLPGYDHAMGFTGYNLVKNGTDSSAGLF